MFSRKGKMMEELEESTKRLKKEREEGFRELWRIQFDQAKGNEHEMTRTAIRYELALHSEWLRGWLEDFDRRVAGEMREHARTMRVRTMWLIILVSILVLDRFWK